MDRAKTVFGVELDDYPNYLITMCGRIWSKSANKYLVPSITDGYYRTGFINKNGKRKHIYIHRLVAIAYLPNPDNLPTVNHKDRNKLNNNIDNLEWASMKDQVLHVVKTGKKNTYRAISQYDKFGNFIKTFESMSLASRELNIVAGTIISSCNDPTRTYSGFYFKYAEASMFDDYIYSPIPNEYWKEINNYPTYWISTIGRVFSERTNRLLIPYIKQSGYITYGINDLRIKAHILVAEAFILKPKSDKPLVVNHKDGNKSNNNYLNLEYLTYSENTKHAYSLNLIPRKTRKIIQLSLDGEMIKEWPSIVSIKKELGITKNKIMAVCKGKQQTANGFKWIYAD